MTEPIKHKWTLRDDDRYECSNCKKIVGSRTLNMIRSVIKTKQKVASSLVYCQDKKKVEPPKTINWEKVRKMFRDAKVIAFEKIEPFMGDDSQEFWEGTDEEDGMFDYLDDVGFDIIPCKIKGESLLTEIYVKFDRFEHPKYKIDFSLSEPVKELQNIETIMDFAKELAKIVQKKFVEITRYRDGIKIFISRQNIIDDDEFRNTVLEKLATELSIEIVE